VQKRREEGCDPTRGHKSKLLSDKKMAKKSSIANVGEILVLIGAIVSLLFGFLTILGIGPMLGFVPHIAGFLAGVVFNIIFGIVVIILSLVTLATAGAIKFKWKLEKNWAMYLLLGILLLIFGGDIGAVLVIIGAILCLF
jgi:uncharacterized membrane protein